MRQLGSKLLAGGLSAGVILLWWPMFFHTDSVTAWLFRGIAWTLCFELLLLALSPFELALWSTEQGARITRKVEAGRALLDHHSPKRRIGRRAGLATVGLAVPLALIAVGASSHIPTHRAAPPKVMEVTRVVRVVKPVRVRRVVKIRTVAQPVPVSAVSGQPAAQTWNTAPVRHTVTQPQRKRSSTSHAPKGSKPSTPTARATPQPKQQATQPTTTPGSGTTQQTSAGNSPAASAGDARPAA